MDIKEIKSERVAEKYYKINHPSGLTIYVYPKDGYNSAYAISVHATAVLIQSFL